jgi:hypothetical protein
VGVPGDYYLDQTDGDIYFSGSNGWEKVYNLMGVSTDQVADGEVAEVYIGYDGYVWIGDSRTTHRPKTIVGANDIVDNTLELKKGYFTSMQLDTTSHAVALMSGYKVVNEGEANEYATTSYSHTTLTNIQLYADADGLLELAVANVKDVLAKVTAGQEIELINPDTINPDTGEGKAYTAEQLVRLGHYPNHVLFTKYGIRPFNNVDYLDGYRPGKVVTEETEVEYNYSLQPGINILEVSPRVTELTFKTTNSNSTSLDTIIIGNLDLVKDNELNPKLDYRIIDDSDGNSAFKQLLADIREIIPAQSFYYNVPTQDTSTIDLNPYVEEDKLSSPLAWYDPNNINNKFVISEIDSSYLTTGITLTKASRV